MREAQPSQHGTNGRAADAELPGDLVSADALPLTGPDDAGRRFSGRLQTSAPLTGGTTHPLPASRQGGPFGPAGRRPGGLLQESLQRYLAAGLEGST